MDSVKCNAALATRGTFREKLYQELGLESFRKRTWYRKLCYFFKIFKGKSWIMFSKYFLELAKRIIKELIITFPTSLLNVFFHEFFFSSTVTKRSN